MQIGSREDGSLAIAWGDTFVIYDPLFPEEVDHDFTALDVLMPHPVYGRNHWVCVLNPSDATFEKLKPLLAEAHDTAFRRIERRSSASGSDAGRPSTSTSSQ